MWPETNKTEESLSNVRQGNDAAENALFERYRECLRRMIELRLDRKFLDVWMPVTSFKRY